MVTTPTNVRIKLPIAIDPAEQSCTNKRSNNNSIKIKDPNRTLSTEILNAFTLRINPVVMMKIHKTIPQKLLYKQAIRFKKLEISLSNKSNKC